MVRYYNFRNFVRSSLMVCCFTTITPLISASTETEQPGLLSRGLSAVGNAVNTGWCATKDFFGAPCPPEPTASVVNTVPADTVTPAAVVTRDSAVAVSSAGTTPRVDPVAEPVADSQSQPATQTSSASPVVPAPDSGLTVSPEGYIYTRDGQIVMTGFEPNRKPLAYEEGMKITYDGSGRPTSVEKGEGPGAVCMLADFQDPSTTGLPGTPAPASQATSSAVAPDLTMLLAGTSEPSEHQSIIDAAKNFRGLPADATVEQIRIYNDNLPIPGRPIDSACGTDFIGPMAPNTFCGPNDSGLAAARSPQPSTAASTTTSDAGDAAETVVGSEEDVIVVTGQRESSEGSTAPESGAISPIPDLTGQDVVTPGDVDPEEAISEAESIATSSAPEPVAAVATVETTPDYLLTNIVVGDEPLEDPNPDDIALTGSSFYSGPASQRTTEDDVINDREQQSLASQPTTTEFEEFDRTLSAEASGTTTVDRMSDSDTDNEVVIVPASTTPDSGVRTQSTTPASLPVAPAGGFRVTELERDVLVARQSLNAVPVSAETVLDEDGNKRVVHTLSDGAVVMGAGLNVVPGDDKAVKNRADLLRQGISEETLNYCDENFGNDYDNCLKFVYENMANFDEDLVRTNLDRP